MPLSPHISQNNKVALWSHAANFDVSFGTGVWMINAKSSTRIHCILEHYWAVGLSHSGVYDINTFSRYIAFATKGCSKCLILHIIKTNCTTRIELIKLWDQSHPFSPENEIIHVTVMRQLRSFCRRHVQIHLLVWIFVVLNGFPIMTKHWFR